MSQISVSEANALELQRLRERGLEIIGPAPVTPGSTPPTPDARVTMPGMHVQIRDGHRLIEGFGGTPDEAVSDALGKLDGYDPTGSVRQPT